MKKTTYILCMLFFCASSCFASHIHNEDESVPNTINQLISASQSEFKGDWTESFYLKDGSAIIHTPAHIKLGFITSGNSIVMKSKSYNGYPMSDIGLSVKTNSTREEFVQALIKSGLYENQ